VVKQRAQADMVAETIVDWIERVSDQVAGAVLESPLAPEVVQLSRREMRAYYRTNPQIQQLLWLPDGSPNAQGRSQLMEQYGADGYEAVALAQVPDASDEEVV
jgi:hypothetical protein